MTNPFGSVVGQRLLEADGSIPYNIPDESIFLESVKGLRSELDGIVAGAVDEAGIDHDKLLNFVEGEHFSQSAIAISAAQTTSGEFASARISQSSVTQHEASLSVGASQVTAGTFGTGAYVFDNTIAVAGGVNNFYRTVNDGNPEIHLGATTLDDVFWQAIYSPGTQILARVEFRSRTTSAVADAGKFSFLVDEIQILELADAGISVIGTGAFTGNVTIQEAGGNPLISITDTTNGRQMRLIAQPTLVSLDSFDNSVYERFDIDGDPLNLNPGQNGSIVMCAGGGNVTVTNNLTVGNVIQTTANNSVVQPSGQFIRGVSSVGDLAFDAQRGFIFNLDANNNSTDALFAIRANASAIDLFTVNEIGEADGTFFDNGGGVFNVKHPDYGAVGDGVNDDTAEIQAALDDVPAVGGTVILPRGNYKVTATLNIKRSRTILRGEGATITFTGASDTVIDAVPTSGTQVEMCVIENLVLDITGSSAKGIDFSAFKHSDFRKLQLQLRTASQIGIFGKGDAAGTGPYYNVFDSITIEGTVSIAGQIGFQLVSGTSGIDLDGPNGNLFSNMRRLSDLDFAFDIQTGEGNMFVNIHAELIITSFARFNSRTADVSRTATGGSRFRLIDTGAAFTSSLLRAGLIITGGAGNGERAVVQSVDSGTQLTLDRAIDATIGGTTVYELYESKAINNKFSHVRIEGTSSANIADFKAGSRNNTICHLGFSSLSTTRWKKDVGDLSNIVSNNAGMVFPFHFAAGTLPGVNVTEYIISGTTVNRGDAGGVGVFEEGAIVGVEMFTFDRTGGVIKPIVRNDNSAVSMLPILDSNSPSGSTGAHCEAFLRDFVEGSAQHLDLQGPLMVGIQSDASFTKGADYRSVVTVWIMQ